MDAHDQKHNKMKTVQQRTVEGTATLRNNGRIEIHQSQPIFGCKWCRVISRPRPLKKTSSKQSKCRDLHLK